MCNFFLPETEEISGPTWKGWVLLLLLVILAWGAITAGLILFFEWTGLSGPIVDAVRRLIWPS